MLKSEGSRVYIKYILYRREKSHAHHTVTREVRFVKFFDHYNILYYISLRCVSYIIIIIIVSCHLSFRTSHDR